MKLTGIDWENNNVSLDLGFNESHGRDEAIQYFKDNSEKEVSITKLREHCPELNKAFMDFFVVDNKEMLLDVKKMIILISSFTEPNTEGEKLLNEWKNKYSSYQLNKS